MIDFFVLAQQCAPQVDYPISQAIVKQESSFNQFAINVNRAAQVKQPTDYISAVTTAKKLISQGYNIDMGLAQINSANLKWLNLSVEQVFDPCTNLKAMQKVYLNCYESASNSNAGLGTRMQRAFSCYNTGNTKNGFKNGYVNKVTSHFNNYLTKNNQAPVQSNQYININRKPLPSSSEDLAIYAENLSLPRGGVDSDDSSINIGEEDSIFHAENIQKQHANWDIFKDF